MESWEEAVAELRAGYVRESQVKLDDALRLADKLASGPPDGEALAELIRRFHAFAGSGKTYGFAEVSALAAQGERECATLRQRGAGPSPLDVDRWRGILEAMKRQLAKDSATPPRREKPQPAPKEAASDILIVDEDEGVRQTLVPLIEQEGMKARSARSKQEALRALEKRLPDGLITDIVLPDGSGYELVEHARALPRGDALPILILSPLTAFLDKVEAIHCGADGYFEKPVDWEALMRRLQHLLERNRAEPARILSVEDDPHQAAFLKMVLESAGHEVRICDNPRRFETELVAFHPDLVLMDIMLPSISGYDLVRYLRQDEKYATLPVLFLTTEQRMQARSETARVGGDDHIVKPVPAPLLLSMVAARLERARFLKGLLDRDGLTRLLTHTAFLERAQQTVAQKHRHPDRSCVWVMLDIDHFKKVNDRYGHPVGDRVLASLAALLRRHLRQSDTIGRYGGEEFAILIDDLSEEDAVRLFARLLDEFAATDQTAPGDVAFRTTFSAGVAALSPEMDLEAWKQAADDALYAAKAAGRRRVMAASANASPSAAAARQ
ncbi:MAG TPA: response regulator [Vicinamibacteria bacterium]|nr:response regulator [Vicinamibacteria bacterium]